MYDKSNELDKTNIMVLIDQIAADCEAAFDCVDNTQNIMCDTIGGPIKKEMADAVKRHSIARLLDIHRALANTHGDIPTAHIGYIIKTIDYVYQEYEITLQNNKQQS